MIRKVVIQNYRKFRKLELEMLPGTNVLVGSNDSGKSTLIEAINLALTGRVNGRMFVQEISPYYINLEATKEYVQALQSSAKAVPPTITIEVYLEGGGEAEILRGTNNLLGEDACGIRIQAKISPDFEEEYRSFAATPGGIRLVPTEYYRVDWLGFSGNGVTARSVPATHQSLTQPPFGSSLASIIICSKSCGRTWTQRIGSNCLGSTGACARPLVSRRQ